MIFDLQNRTKREFRFGHLADLLLGLLEFVGLVRPQQLGLGLSLLLQRALSLLPSLPRPYALVETSLRTRATPGDTPLATRALLGTSVPTHNDRDFPDDLLVCSCTLTRTDPNRRM